MSARTLHDVNCLDLAPYFLPPSSPVCEYDLVPPRLIIKPGICLRPVAAQAQPLTRRDSIFLIAPSPNSSREFEAKSLKSCAKLIAESRSLLVTLFQIRHSHCLLIEIGQELTSHDLKNLGTCSCRGRAEFLRIECFCCLMGVIVKEWFVSRLPRFLCPQ